MRFVTCRLPDGVEDPAILSADGTQIWPLSWLGLSYETLSDAIPFLTPQVRACFAEYYIPTTLKLLHTYNDVQGQQGENAETIRRDIAGILHTLNQAYDTLYDTLLSDVAMDVSSEIAALQGMLASDGLTGGDFQ